MNCTHVINADNYVKKSSRGKRHLIIFIESDPTNEAHYYWVKVAEDNGTGYHTHLNFYVEPKTYRIKYLDVVTNKLTSEKKCREKLMDEYRIK